MKHLLVIVQVSVDNQSTEDVLLNRITDICYSGVPNAILNGIGSCDIESQDEHRIEIINTSTGKTVFSHAIKPVVEE